SHVFVANAHYVIGDLRAWGWTILILSVLQLAAGLGVLAGNQVARWAGVGLLALNLIAQMFFIPAYPFWSLTIIAVDVVALWGLCVYGSRENLEAKNRSGRTGRDRRPGGGSGSDSAARAGSVHRQLRGHQYERGDQRDRHGPGYHGGRRADRHHAVHAGDGGADDPG